MYSQINRQMKEAKPVDQPLRIRGHFREPFLASKLGRALAQYLLAENPAGRRPLVVVAIGTDRSTGDSLGPLVGTKLKQMNLQMDIYGTLEKPVHAINLKETLEKIYQQHSPPPLVIAIDACLGKTESVGCITLDQGALQPGAGVNKQLPRVGDVHFTGIVNISGYMEYFVLQNTRLHLVWEMSDIIASAVYQAFLLYRFQAEKKEGIPSSSCLL
ncbi:MAG: spore protease YyaC [Bacillota bacterium]|jgi:putative sporulation protein YyaC